MTSIAGLRYVKPLFDLARDKEILDQAEDGIKGFSRLMKESPDLESVLLNPRVSAGQKKVIIRELTGEGYHPVIRDFFCLLVDKGREKVLPFLEREFMKLLRESRNIINVTVQSPVSLSDEYKRDLAARFGEFTGKTVELSEVAKPELIAGVRILVGSSMIDGSLKARLDGVRRHLKEKAPAKKTG